VRGSPFVGGVSTPSRGKVYVITLADSSHNTQIWGTTDGGTTPWTQADDGSLAAVTAQPRRLRTRSDGVLVMSAGSDVVAWGQPLV
jgi:hypothetical protein